MIRRLRLALVVVTLVLLQTTLVADLRISGATPSLLLVATLGVAYEEGPDGGAAFGFLAGLAIDCFLNTPLGASALTFALTGWSLGVLQGGLVREMRFFSSLLAFLFGLLGGSIFVVVVTVAGNDNLLTGYGLKVTVLGAVLDALVAPPLFAAVRWARGRDDQARWRR